MNKTILVGDYTNKGRGAFQSSDDFFCHFSLKIDDAPCPLFLVIRWTKQGFIYIELGFCKYRV